MRPRLSDHRISNLEAQRLADSPHSRHARYLAKACPFRWGHICTLGEIGLVEPSVHDEMRYVGQAPREALTVSYHGSILCGLDESSWRRKRHFVGFVYEPR